MDNMGKEYKEMLKRLEEKLKNDENLEYVKSEFTNLFMLFYEEVDALRKLYEDKMETILDRQSYFNDKINKLEEKTDELEKEVMYDEDDEIIRNMLNNGPNINDYEDQECEVTCPYCGEIFFIDVEATEDEVNCPYCTKVIELDWNETSDFDEDEQHNKNDDDM